MEKWKTFQGNCLDIMDQFPDNHFDVIITDPPYELNFMNKKWDNSGIAFQASTWEKALRLLKPGGYLAAFGASRTNHRLICAIEDAGFIIKDSLLWVTSQGFPKSMNISKAIDKKLGVDPTIVGDNPNYRPAHKKNGKGFDKTVGAAPLEEMKITKPASELAQKWDGYGTALKPCYEKIVLGQKPLEGTYIDNILEHGVGAINIDACRLPLHEGENTSRTLSNKQGWKQTSPQGSGSVDNNWKKGRWPGNILFEHHPDCELKGTKKVKSSSGGKQSGINALGQSSGWNKHNNIPTIIQPPLNPDGSETMENWECHIDCPVRILDEQTGKGNQGAEDGDKRFASRFFYCGKAARKDRGDFNKHVSVKPTPVMRWLVKLLSPPGDEVLILDPFMGSGSTGKACMLEGKKFVGIEQEPEYINWAEKRIKEAEEVYNKENKIMKKEEKTLFD